MSALSPIQQPTVSFSIYQNNNWTIRRWVNEMIDPASQRIILKIVGFQDLGEQGTPRAIPNLDVPSEMGVI